MKAHEAECVALKRRGAERVAKALAGKSVQERLEFWRRRTEDLLARQTAMTSATKPRGR